jgi:16S rRNA (cytosine1402-N4)-methyltransferase
MGSDALHVSVLADEALERLAVRSGKLYVDGTVGLGGHAERILAASSPDGRLLGFDRDADALARAEERLRPFGERVRLVHATFDAPQGILLDLGVSSLQLDTPERGFSFRHDGPLDMRMDRDQETTAADLVNGLGEEELANVIYTWGEERASRRIARVIVRERERTPIRTTAQLADIVRRAMGGRRGQRLDPATRTFQALRIEVNREIDGLPESLPALARTLKPGGRLAVIAFHSLEDRAVKQTFRALAGEGFRLVDKKAVQTSETESAVNPRARSARLRTLERVEAA